MSIQPKFLTLTELLGNRLFRIPQYQRVYSWERKHREDMFADIRALAGHEERKHFMATIVGLYRAKKTIVTDEYSQIEVVDGQQRLTTLVLLLKAIEKSLDRSQPSLCKLASEIQELLVKPEMKPVGCRPSAHGAMVVMGIWPVTGVPGSVSCCRTPSRRAAIAFARVTGFWLKYLDHYLIRRPGAIDAASAIYFLGRKSKRSLSDAEIVSHYRGLQAN